MLFSDGPETVAFLYRISLFRPGFGRLRILRFRLTAGVFVFLFSSGDSVHDIVGVIILVIEAQTGVHARVRAQGLLQHSLPGSVFLVELFGGRAFLMTVGFEVALLDPFKSLRIIFVGSQTVLVAQSAHFPGDLLHIFSLRQHFFDDAVHLFVFFQVGTAFLAGGGDLLLIRPVQGVRKCAEPGGFGVGGVSVNSIRIHDDILRRVGILHGIMFVMEGFFSGCRFCAACSTSAFRREDCKRNRKCKDQGGQQRQDSIILSAHNIPFYH